MRTAFMLAQGGEFAFVLLSLAAELKVLPEELNKLLIIVVVISMALTPGLASIGKYLADQYPEEDPAGISLLCQAALAICCKSHWHRSWSHDLQRHLFLHVYSHPTQAGCQEAGCTAGYV